MKATELIKEIESRLKESGARTGEAGSSAEVTQYLKPHASQVAGYKTWQKLGRSVKKGEWQSRR